ncbi:metallophosphoesterase [Paenibacillus sp. IB182496]|uniref:Metallophosphoesterase n=1 Tax=Paenibacillus sabuli TaxID=2772509 RepID=A0A927BUU7_9BACL|nr:metallophosphoesterase [Paenibacillus sabuli]MBD2845798.1 metallophosphoesterase [Paenibacillus sabuli]
MSRRALMLILLFTLVFAALHFYIGLHGWWFLEALQAGLPQGVYWPLLALVALAYVLARVLERYLPYPVFYMLKVVGSYWLGLLMYAVLLLPLADLAALALRLAGVPASTSVPLLGWIVVGALLAVLILGSLAAWRPVVRRYEASIAKPAGKLRSLRVVVASDLHLGTIMRNRQLRRFVERVNALQPELILLPGDILDDDLRPFVEQQMAATMRGLKAKYGVYAVLGNHEYIGGQPDEFARLMQEEAGVEMLLDRTVRVAEGVYISGRKDRSADAPRFGGGRLPLERLLADVDPRAPIILLDHQPYHLDQAAAAGVDVMLSGHTHRGQLAPNHLITRRLFELDWGYLRKGSLHAIVSSGYGFWGPPLRIGSRAELIELTLRFAHEEQADEDADVRGVTE